MKSKKTKQSCSKCRKRLPFADTWFVKEGKDSKPLCTKCFKEVADIK